ncbi:MAG: sulfurtransferase TusA family protein [Deltaproteobacteria bacterium]|nr:sulfurtransferase TusA family protein [Deltaproteobacteria bacterium]
MSEQIDARGLSCPQPVLLTMEKLKTLNQEELVVLVDTDTSRENVSRAAASLGWQVKEVQSEGEEYRITLQKS